MQKESAGDASEHGEDHGRSKNETETVGDGLGAVERSREWTTTVNNNDSSIVVLISKKQT